MIFFVYLTSIRRLASAWWALRRTCEAWWALRRTCEAWWALRIITINAHEFFHELFFLCPDFSNIRIIFRWSSSSYASRDNSWKLFAEAHQAEASHVAKRSVYFRRTDVNIYQLDKNRERGGSSFCFVKPPPWFSALVLYWRLPKTGTHLRSVIKENNGGGKTPPPLDKVIVSWR